MRKDSLITLIIILAVILIAIIIISNSHNNPPNNNNGNNSTDPLEQLSLCIGSRAILYVQLGCHACDIQEDMFGEYKQHLKIVDCWDEREKCVGITATPTWIINGQQYKGVQSIERLKELTGC